MTCPFARVLAAQIRDNRTELVKTWLERISELVPVEDGEVFPGHDLVDHVPLLIEVIAGYMEDADVEITVDAPVMAKAIELGRLRYEQGFDARQILKEYEVLSQVLFDYMVKQADVNTEPCTRTELLVVAHRCYHAIAVIQQHTTSAFLTLDEQRVQEREDRLRGFNRMVSHELRNRIGAAWAAADILREDWLAKQPDQRQRFAGLVFQNLEAIQNILQNLSELSRTVEADQQTDRNALLPDIVARVVDELQEFIEARGVRVEVDDMPAVKVPAAAAEVALNNLITNGAKYRMDTESDSWIRLTADTHTSPGNCEVVVRVQDNGLGVPEGARDHLFKRAFRAHVGVVDEPGSGMGLSIVSETLESFGGRIWAEFPEQGAAFVFSMPCVVPAETEVKE